MRQLAVEVQSKLLQELGARDNNSRLRAVEWHSEQQRVHARG